MVNSIGDYFFSCGIMRSEYLQNQEGVCGIQKQDLRLEDNLNIPAVVCLKAYPCTLKIYHNPYTGWFKGEIFRNKLQVSTSTRVKGSLCMYMHCRSVCEEDVESLTVSDLILLLLLNLFLYVPQNSPYPQCSCQVWVSKHTPDHSLCTNPSWSPGSWLPQRCACSHWSCSPYPTPSESSSLQ